LKFHLVLVRFSKLTCQPPPFFPCNRRKGWSCVDVAAEIVKTIKEQFPDAKDSELRPKVAENLRVCFIRGKRGSQWDDGMTMALHAKHFIVDDICTYVGSQNLYICDLAEWGLVIDDKDATTQIKESFWNPLWKVSYKPEDCDIQAVMDGLEINRDGEDPNHISPETKKLVEDAEKKQGGPSDLLKAGRAGSILVNPGGNRANYFKSDDKEEEKKEREKKKMGQGESQERTVLSIKHDTIEVSRDE